MSAPSPVRPRRPGGVPSSARCPRWEDLRRRAGEELRSLTRTAGRTPPRSCVCGREDLPRPRVHAVHREELPHGLTRAARRSPWGRTSTPAGAGKEDEDGANGRRNETGETG